MSQYRTIVLDPPWVYANTRGTPTRSVIGRRAVTAEHHYPTMSGEAIRDLPVRDLAAADAHLYLWVTNPRLYGGRGRRGAGDVSPIDMLDAWGFEYVTLLTWHKLGAPGMGFYFRGDTEHVIFGVRGRAPIPPASRLSNHIAAHRGRHSEKPDRFYEIVEQVSPEPRLEMFARRRRVGWDVWGNEAPQESAASSQVPMFRESAA